MKYKGFSPMAKTPLMFSDTTFEPLGVIKSVIARWKEER